MAPQSTIEAALNRVDDWMRWWDGLEEVRADKQEIKLGQTFHCTWRSASGYRLRIKLTITKHHAGQYIAFTSEGDLIGKGDFTLSSTTSGITGITITWRVHTAKRWMNALSPLLRPLFIYNHNRLMAAGQKGLVKYVQHFHQV